MSGRSRSKISLAHSTQIISSSPTLVMSWVQPGHGVDQFGLRVGGEDLVGLAREHLAETKARLSLHHQKFLGLGVVVVAAAGDPGVGGEKGELARRARLEHLRKRAARVGVGDKRRS